MEPDMGTSRRVDAVRGVPLWLHCLGLAVVLLLTLPITRPGVAYTSDEGAAVVQARLLEDTGSWLQRDSLARFDPDARARPFPHGDVGTKGRAPYVRHPLYPLVLAGVDGLAGTAGMYLLGIGGTVFAALAAAFLVRYVRPGLGPLTLWVVGLASPLFFDSFVVLAHTVAAAAGGLAVLFALRALGDRRPGWWDVVAAAVLTGLAAALRTEAAFLAGGVAGGAVLAGWRTPAIRARAFAVAVTSIAAVGLVRLAEHWFAGRVLGGAVASGEPGQSGGPFFDNRWHGFLATWLTPGYRHSGLGEFALIVAIVLVPLAVVVMRRNGSLPVVRALLAAAALAYALRFLLGPVEAVPGLVMAFPLGWAGAWLLAKREVAGAGGVLVVGASVVAAGVLVTQYRIGGGIEWGGRYFAIAIPMAAPVLVAALARADRVRQALVLFAVVSSVSLCAMAVQSLRHTHEITRRLLANVSNGAAQAGAPGPGLDRRPVVVSTERLLPQIAWDRYARYQWGAPETAALAPFVHRLALGGVNRFVLVSADPDRQLTEIAADYVEVARPRVSGEQPPVPVLVVQRR